MTDHENTQIVEFVPHEGQKRLFDSTARFIFAMGGKRGGKTTAGCYWAEMQSEKPNAVGLIGAPTFDQLTQSTLVKFFSVFPQLERYYFKKVKMIVLPSGSKIYIRSLDIPKYIEGLNLNWAWIDEADGLNYPTWNILRGRVASTKGRILLTSTIYPDSWIYEYVYKNSENTENMFDIITWESRVNPSFPTSEWESLKKELDPVIFDREYRSQFVWSQGSVYGNFSQEDVIDSLPEGMKILKTFVGLDFGYLDPTAILVVSYGSDNNWYVRDEMYKTGMDIQNIDHWLNYFKGKYGFAYTFVDPQAAIDKHSLQSKFNIIDADKDIAKGITSVRNLIYQHRLKIFTRCYNTLREIRSYSYQRGGVFMKEVPEDRNNHAMDAMRYVLYKAQTFVEGMAHSSYDTDEPELSEFWKRRLDKDYRAKLQQEREDDDLFF